MPLSYGRTDQSYTFSISVKGADNVTVQFSDFTISFCL